jgi:periplasmic protein CpxP/Spy
MTKYLSLLGLSLCAAVTTSLAAEEAKPAEAAPAAPGEAQKIVDARLQMMRERLNLTPEQEQKIGAILLRDQEKFLKLRDDGSETRESRNAKAREILQTSSVELQALLTPEQKQLWQAEAEKQRKAMQERRAAGEAPKVEEKKQP